MKNKKLCFSIVCLTVLLLFGAFTLVACNKSDKTDATSYTVTLERSPEGGGTVSGGGTYESGATVELSATTADAYVFVGWYEGETLLSAEATYSYTVSKDVTITAKWNELTPDASYTVSFDANGGGAVEGLTFKAGDTVTLPTPTYGGYEFLGWYTSDTWDTQISGGTFAAGNKTLYARWGVRVSFDTDGGEETKSVVVDKGASISSLPIAIKSGNAFVGWYVDTALTEEYDYDTALSASITLHAKFSQNLTNVLMKMQHFDDIDENATITVYSDVALNSENIGDYFSITNVAGDSLTLILSVGDAENEYNIQLANGYVGGFNYTAKPKTSDIRILSVGDAEVDTDTTQISYKIYKQEFNDIMAAERTHIAMSQIEHYEENVRTLQTAALSPDNGKTVSAIYVQIVAGVTYVAGGIISIGEKTTETDDDAYYKVVFAKKENVALGDGTTASLWYVEFIEPELEDIYSSFDSYGTGDVDLEQYLNVRKDDIAENINNSKGIKTLSAVINNALFQSPSVATAVSELSPVDQQLFYAQLTTLKLNTPEITFDVSGKSVKVGIKYELEIEVSNVCTITVSLGFSDTLTLTFDFYTQKVENYTWGIFDKYLVQVNTYVANDFTLSFGAEIAFSGTGGKQTKVDIASEVMDIIKKGASSINSFTESLTGDPLYNGDEGALDYIEIINQPFGEIPIPLTNVLTFSIEFDGVISLGGKAGLFIDVEQKYAEQINIANGKLDDNGKVVFYDDGFTATRKHLESNFDLKITLKGKIGVRFGVEMKLKLSVAHLNSVGSVYVSATVGPYFELTGIAVFDYNYNAIKKESTFSVYGGIYVEFGYFVNFKLGLDTLIYDSDTSLWSGKIKSYTYGSKIAYARFSEFEQNPKTMWERSINYKNLYPYEVLDVLNLGTGEMVNGKYYYGLTLEYSIDQSKDYAEFVEISSNGAITIKSNYKGSMLQFNVHIKVKNQNSLIGKTLEKDVPIMWMDPGSQAYVQKVNYGFYNRYHEPNAPYVNTLLTTSATYVGKQISVPILSAADLPERDGYYLDTSDLWVKYKGSDVDESWDGTFGEASIDDYTNMVSYRLKWKQIKFTANYYLPVYDGETALEYELKYTNPEVYVYHSSDGYSYFVKKYYDADKKYGLDFKGYSLSGYNSYVLTVGEYFMSGIPEGTYSVYSNGFETAADLYADYAANGLNLYGVYRPITYAVNWTLATYYTAPHTDTYKVLDYAEGEDIALSVPTGFEIGELFYDTFAIAYYTDEVGNRYDTLVGATVTKNTTYTAHATTVYNWLSYRIEGDSIYSGYSLGTVRLAEGDTIPLYGETELKDKVAAMLPKNVESFTVILRTNTRTTMPDSSYTVYYDVSCVYKSATVTFTSTDVKFMNGYSEVNTASYTGYYANSDSSAQLTYMVPTLKQSYYYKPENGVLYQYSFSYWYDATGKVAAIAGDTNKFNEDYNFEPVFTKKSVDFKVDFQLDDMRGSNVYYFCARGNYYGKTLTEVIAANSVITPVRTDYFDSYTYAFTGWSYSGDFVFGSETDLAGDVKTTYVITGGFSKAPVTHTITLDANGGTYSDGTTDKTISGTVEDITDLSAYTPTRAADGDNTYVFIGWSNSADNKYLLDNIDGVKFPSENVTYYAVYASSPQERTITVKAGGVTGEQGGEAYFDFADGKTDTITQKSYDGKYFWVYAHYIKMDNAVYECKPSYVMSGSGDNATIFYFENGSVKIVVSGDAEFTVYYDEPQKIVYTAVFNSVGRVDNEGEELVINGFMQGYVFNKYLTGEYGDTVTAPSVIYTGYNFVKFAGWKCAVYAEGESEPQYATYAAGDTVTLESDMYLTANYVVDDSTTYTMEFNAGVCFSNRAGLYGEDEITGTPMFADGSYTIKVIGTYNTDVYFTKTPSLNGHNFVGWTDTSGNAVDSFGVFDGNRTYYAKYEKSEEYTVALNADNGKFSDETTVKTVSAAYGKVCTTLDEPTPDDAALAFSYYADAEGNVVNVITGNAALYAVYATPIYTFDDLHKIELNPNGSFVLKNSLVNFSQDIADNTNISIPLCVNAPNGFNGVLNGAGYTIGYYTTKVTENIGLFAKLSGKVMNVAFAAQYYIDASDSVSVAKYTGLAAGVITESGVVENCYFGGMISLTSKVQNGFSMGFIAGENRGTINNCSINFANSRVSNSLESNGTVYVGCTVGVNKGEICGVKSSGSIYSLGVANSFALYYGSVAGYNSGSVKKCVILGNIMLNFMNGMNNYGIGKFTVGNLCGKDDGSIEGCYYSSEFNYTVSNITMTNPDTSTEFTGRLVHLSAKEGSYPEMFQAWTPANAKAFSLVVSEDDEITSSMNQTYHLSSVANASQILAYITSVMLYNVANGSGDYSSCVDYSTLDYDTFEIVSALGMSDYQYGWLEYIDEHSDGLKPVG